MQNQNVANCLARQQLHLDRRVAQTGDLSFKPATTDAVSFITDLSSCYSQAAGTVRRGIRMLNGRRQVLVQDEIGQSSSITDVKWRVQTNGTVSLSADGKTATLTQSSITDPNAGVVGKVSLGGTKTMKVQILSPSNAVFTATGPPATRIYGQAVYSAPPEDSDQVNTGVTALQIDLNGTQSGARPSSPVAAAVGLALGCRRGYAQVGPSQPVEPHLAQLSAALCAILLSSGMSNSDGFLPSASLLSQQQWRSPLCFCFLSPHFSSCCAKLAQPRLTNNPFVL